jgi:hypothetical protein
MVPSDTSYFAVTRFAAWEKWLTTFDKMARTEFSPINGNLYFQTTRSVEDRLSYPNVRATFRQSRFSGLGRQNLPILFGDRQTTVPVQVHYVHAV